MSGYKSFKERLFLGIINISPPVSPRRLPLQVKRKKISWNGNVLKSRQQVCKWTGKKLLYQHHLRTLPKQGKFSREMKKFIPVSHRSMVFNEKIIVLWVELQIERKLISCFLILIVKNLLEFLIQIKVRESFAP